MMVGNEEDVGGEGDGDGGVDVSAMVPLGAALRRTDVVPGGQTSGSPPGTR